MPTYQILTTHVIESQPYCNGVQHEIDKTRWKRDEKKHLKIVAADYSDDAHRRAIPQLLNAYAKDLLGFCKSLEESVLKRLVAGLEAFPTAIVLLARVDGVYAGMAICFLGFSTFNARPLLNIHDFMVLQEYRLHGIGKALLTEVERIAREKGCCKMTLEVQMKNEAARRIYQSFGFKASFLDPEAGEQLSLTKNLARGETTSARDDLVPSGG